MKSSTGKKQKRGLKWTDGQKEIAKLFSEGKVFQEIISLGRSKTMTSKVLRGLERGEYPQEWSGPITINRGQKKAEQEDKPSEDIKPSAQGEPPAHVFQTKYSIGTDQPVPIGEIQVLPEDWRITQHGYFLILETFYETKQEVGYDGSIGQFIVDVFRIFRRVMQFAVLPEVGPALKTKEDSAHGNGRGEETDSGERVYEESGVVNREEANGGAG